MKARIYSPVKTAMQMGRARTKGWVLEFTPQEGLYIEPVMKWTGTRDTQAQVKLIFSSELEACEYAEKHHLTYEIIKPHSSSLKLKSYSHNFK